MDAIALHDREHADRRDPDGPDRHGSAVADEAARRRTFAVISHPDAGKSTLTEALALHARAIARRAPCTARATGGASSPTGWRWRRTEASRSPPPCSSSPTTAMVINLLDTPGHADFSEDTYRVLAAVDAAVMLVDAAKGIEPQTFKLFEVCRARGVPVITVVNKWDRPGLDALAIMDELTTRIDLHPMPLTWPVGVAATSAASSTAPPASSSSSRVRGWRHRGRVDAHERGGGRAGARLHVDRRRRGVRPAAVVGARSDHELFLSGAASPVLSARPSSTSGYASCSTRS